MSVSLRVLLFIAPILTCIWILRRIRSSQVRIEDSVFWFLFSLALLLMGMFPGAVQWAADFIGVQSTVNFVFLAILFILIVKLFRMSIRISQIESRFQSLVQRYAIDQSGNFSKDVTPPPTHTRTRHPG